MKLRNLMYATMVACAFASCSNDDGIDDNGGKTPEGATAQLEVKITAPLVGKSVDQSAAIASLGVLVFDVTTNTLEAKGIDAGRAGEGKSVLAKGLTAGEKKVLVLANMESTMNTYVVNSTTLNQVLTSTQDFNSQAEVDGSLSMNSGIYEVTLKAGVTNYLGYANEPAKDPNGNYLTEAGNDAVKLYRNVARIVLESVQLTANSTKYPKAKFTVNRVFVLHGNKTTKVATEKPWDTTMPSDVLNYLNGCTNQDYAGWVAFMSGKEKKQAYLDNSNYEEVSAYSKTVTGEVLDYNQKWQPTNQNFYVYENTSTTLHTLLVVEGKLEYGDVTGDKAELRYYSVAIGKDGMTNIDEKTGVYPIPENFDGNRDGGLTGTVRNIQYNVKLQVAGPGYTSPFGPDAKDETKLDVQVEVVNFGAVNQNVTIE